MLLSRQRPWVRSPVVSAYFFQQIVTLEIRTVNGRLTGQGALISDRDQLCYRTISEMFQSNFQLARKEICIPGHDLLVPEERSTGKRNNSAFLASILAGKLPNSH